ncbi:MAG: PHP domain-containing protein [Lachnospiraceae bacterium]|nr:PHP domain-containing protein [Lachnospiraceae bacterium]
MRKASDIFLRMSELTPDNSRMDMHMHTTWTDGARCVSEMISTAEENGLLAIAVTDHIRKESDYYPEYLKEISAWRETAGIAVFSGFEAKIMNMDGEIDIPEDAARSADIVIASVHRIPMNGTFVKPRELDYDLLAATERDLALAAIRRSADDGTVNVLGHCGGMTISAYGKFPEDYFEAVIRQCSACGVAFEYNYKYHGKYERQIKELLEKYDPYVSAGSDAHDTEEICDRSFIIG